MKLPDPTPVTAAALDAIAARHGLRFEGVERIDPPGIINTVYALGDDHVLRVPRRHPAHADQARREVVAIPAARAAGVGTPAVIAFDDACDILPVPYLVVERVHGRSVEALGRDPEELATVWRALGAELARLRTGVDRSGPAARLERGWRRHDPRVLVEERAGDGWLSPVEARWLGRWLDRLEPAAAPGPERLVHGDAQMSDVLVDAEGRYLALIDWGCAGWAEDVVDLLPMPMATAPHLLAGHRDVVPLDGGDAAEARIVWRRLQLILQVLPRGAAPGTSWGERPVAWLTDLLRFFLAPPDDRWRAVAPPR